MKPQLVERPPGPWITRHRNDHAAQMLAIWVLVPVLIITALGMGVIYGRMTPLDPVPVAEMRHDY